MRKILSSLFGVMLATFALSPAFADEVAATEPVTKTNNFYYGVTFGQGFQSENTNNRGNSTFLGFKFGEDYGVYDLEAEAFRDYTNGKGKIGNIDVYGLMVNGKYKWLNQSEFTPFIKGGVGVGNITGSGVYNDGNHLLVSGGVGTYYTLSDKAKLELAYTRYWSPVDVRNNTCGREDYQDDVVSVGLNFDL